MPFPFLLLPCSLTPSVPSVVKGCFTFAFCLFTFAFPRRGFCRCSPLLFGKINAEKANKINLLGGWKSKFPCIYSDYSENLSPSIQSTPLFDPCPGPRKLPPHRSLAPRRVRCSHFTAHGSRLTLPGSRLTVHPSRFTLHSSPFTLHPSPFTVKWPL